LLVLVAVAAAIALAPLIPLGPLRPEIEARLSDFFDREVRIGSMRLSLLGGPYLTMKRVTIKNGAGVRRREPARSREGEGKPGRAAAAWR
jgi:hypothetical protein